MSSDLELPPPAYEELQQEVDQKIATACELSLAVSNTSGAQASDDGWEYDEAAFEAAFAAAAARQNPTSGSFGSSTQKGGQYGASSSTSVQPLQVTKKGVLSPLQPLPKERPSWYSEAGLTDAPSLHSLERAPSPGLLSHNNIQTGSPHDTSLKERPRWYAEAGVDGTSSHTSLPPNLAHSAPSSPYDVRAPNPSPHTSVQHEASGDDDVDRSEPPPAFTPVGPSLEGPPFEEVVLAYPGDGSTPPSPLSSPQPTTFLTSGPSRQLSQQINLAPTHIPEPQIPSPSHSMPPQRVERGRMGARPSTFSGKSHQVPSAPRMDFNHSVAYHKPTFDDMHTAPSGGMATSFYNSAVAGHMIGGPTKPTNITTSGRPHSTSGSRYFRPHSSYYPQHRPLPPDTQFPATPFHQQPSVTPTQSSVSSAPAQMQQYQSQLGSGPNSRDIQNRWAYSEEQIAGDFY